MANTEADPGKIYRLSTHSSWPEHDSPYTSTLQEMSHPDAFCICTVTFVQGGGLSSETDL